MRQKARELEAQAAAYLYSQGYRQADIATVLDLSQPVISRLLKLAKKEGWLEDSVPRFVVEKISPQRKQEIEARVSPQQLKKQLQGLVTKSGVEARPDRLKPNIRITGIRLVPMAKGAVQGIRLKEYGQTAAGYVEEVLRSSKVCGVAWGRTVASIVEGFGKLGVQSSRKGNPIQFVPVCGEPLGGTVTRFSSSTLAAQLDQIINGGMSHSFSLAAVPALIPMAFPPKEVETIRKLLGYVEAYRDIFEGKNEEGSLLKPWIDRIDSILTSVAPAEETLVYGANDLIRMAGIDRKRLRELVVGDLCGTLIPRPGLSARECREVEKINNRWTGIQRQDLERCADKASQNRAPGVIVVAAGRDKAEIVYEGVKCGLINQLVIGEDLARELEHLLNESQ